MLPFKPKFLSDADGCVAPMVPALVDWANVKFGFKIEVADIVFHSNMGRSPALRDIDRYLRRPEFYPEEGSDGGFGGAFLEFMRQPDVYTRYMQPEANSQLVIASIAERCDTAFVTALMKKALVHVPDKLKWLGQHYPDMTVITCPGAKKHWIPATFIVEDRYDTCTDWAGVGAMAFLFRQPWNEAPAGTRSYDWLQIGQAIHSYLDAWRMP